MVARSLDHKPILLSCRLKNFQGGRKSKLFHYEGCWNMEECSKEVEHYWKQQPKEGDPIEKLCKALHPCIRGLTTWSIEKFCGIPASIKSKSSLLKSLQYKDDHTIAGGIELLQKELNDLMDKEDIKWRQRVKHKWYKERDRNTKFFHLCASQLRKKNSIHIILEENREWTEDSDIATTFCKFCTQLYTSSSPSHSDIEECTKFLEPRITDSMASDFNRNFTREEVKRALKQMDLMKSSRPNGFGACFYQKH